MSIKLSEFLYDLDFEYLINDDNTLSLIDLQGANLGNIESETYKVDKDLAMNIIDRLDRYIYDYFLDGYIDTLRHECHEDVKGGYFPDILEQMKKHPDKFDGCFEVMESIINPELFDISEIIADVKIIAKCPRCNHRLRTSPLKDYTYFCPYCTEDFYSIEVKEN